MDALIELLFKYRPIAFEKGDLIFGTPWLGRLLLLLVGGAALAALVTYMRVRVRGTRTDRFLLGGLRALLVVTLLILLFRPTLVVPSAIAQRNVVGVVIDDSRSMQVADMDGRPRSDVVRKLLGGPDSALYKALTEKFIVRFFHLGSGGRHVAGVDGLAFDASRTELAPALEGVRQELSGAAVSGLVLVSDGADNSPGALDETLVSLNARKIPVFTVGIGQERFARDIEISRVEAPRTVLKDAIVVISVDITQRGYGGHTLQLVVEDEGRIVSSESITLPGDAEVMTVRVRVPTASAGLRRLTARIAPQPGEQVVENNARQVLVTVRDKKEKILYVEGEPRFELKFLRRAVERDENLQLVTMVRTAKDRFLRLSVDDSLELATGFPQTREELFSYQAIVLGSIEASFFTLDQLRMISDFVSERGGGLLMLGGRTAFAEGGYGGTPVADALPVELPVGQASKPTFREVKVSVTTAGALYPATQIAATEGASIRRWTTMPVVTSVNLVTQTKPGATTLLAGTVPRGKPGGGEHSVVLASQRFGLGRTLAFPIQDSWIWQMDSEIPVEDVAYQSFWRQVLRWLVNDVAGQVTVTPAADQVGPYEPININAEVVDRGYNRTNSAQPIASITTPSGTVVETPMQWSVTRDGEYRLAYTPAEVGVYRIDVKATVGSEPITSDPAFVSVDVPTAEYFGAEQRPSLLRRVAEETGGRYYTPATATALARDLVFSPGGNTELERLELWDMPIVFVLILALLAAEWGIRRARGLV